MRNGVLKIVTGTDPAAGVECSEAVPAGKYWRPLTLRFSLVADATVASRIPVLNLDDGSTVFYQGASGTSTASTTFSHGFSNVGQTQTLNVNTINSILPDVVLGPGYRIRTVTNALQAGDNYAAPVFYVVEYGGHPEFS